MASTEHRHPNTDQGEEESVTETVTKSVTGEDEPMEREHPVAPFGFVWYTYPIALIILLTIAILVLGTFWGGGEQPQ